MPNDVTPSELSALDVRLIQWSDLPFGSDQNIMEIWGPRDLVELKNLIDRDGGIRDSLRCARIKGEKGKPILFDGYTRLLIYFVRKAEGKNDAVPAFTVVDFNNRGDVLQAVLAVQGSRRNVTAPQIANAALMIKAMQGFDIAPKRQGRPKKGEKRNDTLLSLPSAKTLAKEFGVSDKIIRLTQDALAHRDPVFLAGLLAKPEHEAYLSPIQVDRKIKAYERDKVAHTKEEVRQRRAEKCAKLKSKPISGVIKPDGIFTTDAIEGMKRIEAGTVDFVCTSIPYACAMPYDVATPFQGDYADYLDKYVRQFLAAAKTALKIGGRVGVNFDCTYRSFDKQNADNRSLVPNVFNLWKDLGTIAEDELGFLFMGYRVWYKQNCCTYFSKGSRSSTSPSMNPNTEFVLIFAKDSMHLSGESDITQREYDRFAVTNWYIRPQQRAKTEDDAYHPCPYPEELVYRLLRMYSPKNGVILDPYSGSGTTAFVAKALGRRYIGLDNSPLYNLEAQKRLATLEGLSATDKIRQITRFLEATEHGFPKHHNRKGVDPT